MSTQQVAESSKGLLTTPQAPLVSTFIAVILGASLIEFNELLFPPKVTSLNFWALVAAYYGAITSWFRISTMSRHHPYTDTFLARFWLLMLILALVSLLALMYFATRATDSFLVYMWGWVIVFVFLELCYIVRHLDIHLPEPIGLCAIFTLIAIVTAIAYSIWVLAFPPVPDIANWVFIFAAFATIVSFRQLLRARHYWPPTPNDQHQY